MKSKKINKDFDSVEFFQKVKEEIAKEFEGKTFEQKKEIIKKAKSRFKGFNKMSANKTSKI
ncbi:MAG: hypothetical protein WAT71_06160 [Ignavibacteria bacterium]